MTVTAVPTVSPVALQHFVILQLATGTKIELRKISNTVVKCPRCEHGLFFVPVLHYSSGSHSVNMSLSQ